MMGIFPVSRVLFVCCLMFVLFPLYGQSQREHVEKGNRYYLKKDYRNALDSFVKALALDPDDPLTNYKAGISSIDQKQFGQAVLYLEKAYGIKPDVDPDIDYHLGVAYQNDHQYAKARKHFESLKNKNKRLAAVATRKISECIAGDSLMKLPPAGKVVSIDGDFNTTFSEFAPLISADGQTFIFSSNRSDDQYQIKSGSNLDDVYISHKQGSIWTAPVKIDASINVQRNEVATSVSSDGRTLFLYYEDGAGDIYTSTNENGIWSRPAALNRFINHPQYCESAASISADGRRLYFSSNRPGGKGGFDIYVSEMGPNGQWGRPSNLGSRINTRHDEVSPFIHHDGKTLYFSSNGHTSLGDHDLFRSRIENGKWSAPENLGYPINTSAHEGFLTITPDGRTGYFSSRRKPGQSDTDIYSILFKESRPIAEALKEVDETTDLTHRLVAVLKGSVIDVKTATPLQATLTLVEHSTKKEISRIRTDESGNFQIVIPRGGNYGLTTQRAGYLFNSMNFSLPPIKKYQEIDTHVLMVKAAVGSKVVLKNIFFDVSESALKEESLSELQNIRDLLLQNPKWRIRINGHTDNVGHAEANRVLSLKRAEAVVGYLVANGIPAARLEAKGFGSDRPLVSNDDEKEGRQINRRTEIEIIE